MDKRIRSKDMALLLNPSEKRVYPSPSCVWWNATLRKYLALAFLSMCMVFYLSYTGSLSWTQMQHQQQGDEADHQGGSFNEGAAARLRAGKPYPPGSTLPPHHLIETKPTPPVETEPESIRTNTDGPYGDDMKMTCHLPDLKPYDNSVLRFVEEIPEPANCEKDHPLMFDTDLESNLIQVRNPEDYGYSKCCYQGFSRKLGSDKNINIFKSCVPIVKKQTKVPDTIEFIRVTCKFEEGDGNVTQKNVDYFGFVHLKDSVETRVVQRANSMYEYISAVTPEYSTSVSMEAENPGGELGETGFTSASNSATEDVNGERKANVVILGLDALSHMNFIRTMPLSFEYITKNLSALGMSGYTKVGDNTFPNIVPVLTGSFVEEIKKTCWKSESDRFDQCPFVWKNYAASGYRTAYGEDAVWMGIFNYVKRGFKEAPTDYYWNTLTYQLEDVVGHHKLMNAQLCYGPRMGFEISLDYLRKMAFTMGKTRRYFQFIWATSLFHDYLNEGKLGDKPLLQTLQWFQDGGYLEDTIFILMSDHGIRWGDIRSTLQGRLEERLPFLYFIFPDWFKEKYHSAVSYMTRNQKKLTTPFDLHETLMDLLNLPGISQESLKQRHAMLAQTKGKLPRGISLFLPVPSRRTCADAEIEDHWCVCRSLQPVSLQNNTLVTEAGRSAVYHINGMFVRFPQCSFLVLKAVLNAQVFLSNNGEVQDSSSTIVSATDKRLAKQAVTFTLSFIVSPSNATFEATITRHTNGTWEMLGGISRTNVYGDQSICVSDYNLKKFCYCG